MVAKCLDDNKSKIHLKSEFALFYSEIRCIALCVLHILGFSVPSIILADFLGNTYLLARVQKVIICDSCDWWISIRFVCFVFQGSLLCDRPVSGNNQLVKFALQIFMIFLILVTWKNKATSASFLKLSQAGPSWASIILSFALTPPSPRYNEFRCKLNRSYSVSFNLSNFRNFLGWIRKDLI